MKGTLFIFEVFCLASDVILRTKLIRRLNCIGVDRIQVETNKFALIENTTCNMAF